MGTLRAAETNTQALAVEYGSVIIVNIVVV
jgi:hypothetical protein